MRPNHRAATPGRSRPPAGLWLAVFGGLLSLWASVGYSQPASSEVLDSLRRRDVYIADTARSRVSEREETELQAFADQQRAQGRQLKMAVLDRPPGGFRTLGQFVEAAHGALDLTDGVLIAVAMDAGTGSGSVSAKTRALDDATIQRIQQTNVGSFTAGTYAEGLRALAEDLTQEIQERRAAEQTRNRLFLLGVMAIGVGAASAVLVLRVSAWRRELAAVNGVRDSLYPLLRRLDDDLPYVEATEEGRKASEAHAAGSERYHRATEVLDEMAGIPWFKSALPGAHHGLAGQARAELTAAQRHLADANAILDRAGKGAR